MSGPGVIVLPAGEPPIPPRRRRTLARRASDPVPALPAGTWTCRHLPSPAVTFHPNKVTARECRISARTGSAVTLTFKNP